MKHKFSLMWRVAVALVLVLSFSLVMAVPASAGTLVDVTATPKVATAGETTIYTIGFTTATTWAVEKVEMDFGTGSFVANEGNVSGANTVVTATGIGAGSITNDGTKVIYTVTASPAPIISAETAITIKFSSIKNPKLPAIYSPGVKVTTQKDSTVIDTGTATVTITAMPVKNISTGVSYTTIQDAINAASANQTITVAAGTYTLTAQLKINGKKGLTLKGANYGVSPVTETRGDESIISSSATDCIVGIGAEVPADDVTIDGFTFKGSGAAGMGMGIYCVGDGFTIQNNRFIDIYGHANINAETALYATTSGTIDNNTFVGEGDDAVDGIILAALKYDVSGVTISNNTLSDFVGSASDAAGICLATASGSTMSDITVTGNTVTDSGWGLGLWNPGTMEDIDVTDNTFSGCLIGVKTAYGAPTNLTITGNDITGNTTDGIKIEEWDATNAINNNNIYGNTDYGINNTTTTSVDAEDNWWGTCVESAIDSMVYGDVDYTPWLNAAYPDGEPVTTDYATVSLYEGWNLISLSMIPDDSDITKVISADTLDDVSNVSLVRSYDPVAGTFPRYEPGVGGDLTTMEDGYGYWVFMGAADTLIVAGHEMPTPPATPPTYPVVEGWNLIGFKSAVDLSDSIYLDNLTEEAVGTGYSIVWSYDAETGKYSNVKGSTMEVGHGFWLWATEDGTIVPGG